MLVSPAAQSDRNQTDGRMAGRWTGTNSRPRHLLAPAATFKDQIVGLRMPSASICHLLKEAVTDASL